MSCLKKAKSSSSIIIIGSGLAGYTLVRELRKIDAATPITVITADDGSYYSKPQISTALSHQKAPPQLALFSAEKFSQQFNVQVVPYTRVLSIDTQARCCITAYQEFFFEKLILACGAQPVHLPWTASTLQVNNLLDYARFREAISDKQHVAIVGTGLVGCEFANDLLSAGYRVTLIGVQHYPLARFVPEAVGKHLQETFTMHGAIWHLGRSVQKIIKADEKYCLSLSDGQTLSADVVLSAVGLRSDISLAKQANLVTQNGVVVNEYLQTSCQDIFALGDCAEVNGAVMPYIAPLTLGARALAGTLTGNPTKASYPPMPIYVKTSLCPVIFSTPPNVTSGNWEITQTAEYVKALFFDTQQRLQGFALTNQCTIEAVDLIKHLSQHYS